MLPEIGHYCLIVALGLAFLQVLLPLYGCLAHQGRLIQTARSLAFGQSLFVVTAFVLLVYAFVTNDFSVAYVANNANTHLPLFYRMTAVWGAHEGSLLLWVTILALWTTLVALCSQQLSDRFRAQVLLVMGAISFGFLLFLLMTSNPFLRLLINTPIDGHDLNPLLQDFGFVIHPPMLYIGYVGTTVAFAFALAALMAGKLDAAWARWSLPWTIVAWCFLTYGIILGSWWSYRDLGWGGWWFWDPVENASFMPWLVTTALIHSLIVTAKRGAFKNWTVLLAILAFLLSLLGTFLTRSGIIVSVHAFAVDPARGLFMLRFLGLVLLVSLLLYGWRASAIGQGGRFSFVSRESMLLVNNVLLFVLMATVFLGTLYPLALQVLGVGHISVGPPYFNMVFVPIFCLLLFFMCLVPSVQWQQMSVRRIVHRSCIGFLLSFAFAMLLPWLMTKQLSITLVVGLGFAFWLIVATLQDLVIRIRGSAAITKNMWAMSVAHVGVAVTVIGITLSVHYSEENNAVMHIGAVENIGPYQLQLMRFEAAPGPNYEGTAVFFELLPQHKVIVSEKRLYTVSQSVMSIPGIAVNIWRDVYVAIGAIDSKQETFEVRLYYKPFVRWIWYGGLLMILGGGLSLRAKPRRPAAIE